MDKTAIKPNFLFNIPSLQEADSVAEKRGATDEERAILAMTHTKGWLIFKDYLKQLSDELAESNRMAISNGASLEEIGRNAVVITLAQDIITRALNKVTDSVDACTEDEQ